MSILLSCLKRAYLTIILACSTDRRSKFSKKRTNEDEGDITYINERNKVFNKKVSFLILKCISFSDYFCSLRLLDTTISIPQRSAPVSREEPLCDQMHVVFLVYRFAFVCWFLTCLTSGMTCFHHVVHHVPQQDRSVRAFGSINHLEVKVQYSDEFNRQEFGREKYKSGIEGIRLDVPLSFVL